MRDSGTQRSKSEWTGSEPGQGLNAAAPPGLGVFGLQAEIPDHMQR